MGIESRKTLLLIDGNPADVRLLRDIFDEQRPHNAELTHAACMRDAEKHLAEHAVDIILLDLALPDAQGLAAVRQTHAAAPGVPLVVLRLDESLALQALQEGAQDYLIKGQIDTRGLLRALRYAVERKTLEEALFAEKERAQVTLNCIGDAVACTDSAGNITFVNPVAEKMTGWSWQDAHSIDEHDLRVTTSIGVSVYPDDGQDAETLIRNADTAMYQTKADGRKRYRFFKLGMNVRAAERPSVEENLRSRSADRSGHSV